jgi:cell division protein ZipA
MVVDPQRSVPGSVGIDIADEFAIDEPGLRREPRIDDGAFETAEEEEVEPGFTAEPPPEEDPTGELEPIQAVGKRPPPEPRWPPEEQRRIVSLRLVPRPPARFGGRSLRLAFEGCGLEFGAFDIFHLADETGAVVASAANLMRPGTFAPDGMDTQYFHGVHLFCVLPGPLPAGRAVDELIALARDLAQRASGIVLDEVGRPLDEERAAAVRAEAEQAEAALAERGG